MKTIIAKLRTELSNSLKTAFCSKVLETDRLNSIYSFKNRLHIFNKYTEPVLKRPVLNWIHDSRKQPETIIDI